MKRVVPALAFLLVAPVVLAQGTAGSVELTPLVGYWFGDTLARGTIQGVDFNVTVDDAPAYGLDVSYKFAPNWGLDLLLAHSRADLLTGTRQLFSGTDRVGTLESTAAEVGVEGSFGHSRFVPYVSGGVGAMYLNPRITGVALSSDTRFVGHFGAGFKLFLTPDIALRLGWRVHSVNVRNSHHGGCDWWEDCHYQNDWLNLNEVALGLTFAL
jgi:hypothetical protein